MSKTWKLLWVGIATFLLAVLLSSGCAKPESQPMVEKAETAGEPLLLSCLHRGPCKPFLNPDTQAVVLVFIGTDCPIANAFHPELKRLSQAYSKSGVRFFLVHSVAGVTPDEANRHAAEYDLTLPIVLDGNQEIAQRVGARVTPEAVVLVRDQPQPVYRGAINNLYEGFGKKRSVVTQHWLVDAVDAILNGRAVATPTTVPVGCFIAFDG